MAVLTGTHTINAIGPNRNPNTSGGFDNFTSQLWPPQISANLHDVMATKLKRPSKSKKKKLAFGPRKSRPYMGSSYAHDYFYRIRIIEPSVDFGTFTDSTTTFQVWNAYFTDQPFTVINTTAVDADGLVLTGSTSGTISELDLFSYTLAAGPDGNPSIDVSYTWDFGISVTDPTLFVEGQRTVLLPWIALESMQRSLSWLTGIIKTYGSEQRRGLRRAPRQEISYDIHLPGRDRLDFETRVKSFGSLYAVPLWFDVENVGALPLGATVISVTTGNSFYKVGGLVFIYQSKSIAEAKTIASIGSGQITFTSGIARTYTNALMMPAVAGFFSKDPTIDRDSAGNSFAALSFTSVDFDEINVGTYPQHRGLDVLVDPSVLNDTVQMQITQSRSLRDNNIGPIGVGIHENRIRTQDTQRWLKSTRAGRWQLEQWLHSRYGQRKPFYYPTWAEDFVVTADFGSGSTFIDVEATPMLPPFDIMVELNNGTTLFGEVISKTLLAEDHRLNLQAALGLDVDAVDIRRTSLLRLTRHASDNVTMVYESPNITRAEIPTTTF